MTRLYNSNDKDQSRTHMLGYFVIEDINLKENIVCENLSFQNSFKKNLRQRFLSETYLWKNFPGRNDFCTHFFFEKYVLQKINIHLLKAILYVSCCLVMYLVVMMVRVMMMVMIGMMMIIMKIMMNSIIMLMMMMMLSTSRSA